MGKNEGSFEPLLERAQDGDQSALGHLLEENRGWLKRDAQRSISSNLARRQDASDLAQESLATASQAIDQFRGRDPGTFRGWLRGIQRNLLRRLVRGQAARAARESGLAGAGHESLEDSGTSLSEMATRRESLELLMEALNELDADDRRLVRRRYLDQDLASNQYAELSREWGCSADLLRQRMCRLLKKLESGMPLLAALQQGRVPPHLSRILCWQHFRGWNVTRVAHELGCQQQTARTLIEQAETSLRQARGNSTGPGKHS